MSNLSSFGAIDHDHQRSLWLGRRSLEEYGEGLDLWGTKDATRIINMAFADAAVNGYEIQLPIGRGSAGRTADLKTTQPLVWPGPYPRISGGGEMTRIRPDSPAFDWLVVGTGVQGEDPFQPAGWVRDFHLHGLNETVSPSGFTAGLVLDGARYVEVRNIGVRYSPIGIDLRKNSHGSSFSNCRTAFDHCRIGIWLSGSRVGMTPFASGNDQTFYNCWFSGREAAIWCDNAGGGYHFHGGHMSSGDGTASPSDDRGTLTIGKDLELGTINGQNQGLTFTGTSFESAKNGRPVRCFGNNSSGGVNLVFIGCVIPADTGSINIMKISSGYDDHVTFDNCRITGAWSSTVAVEMGTNLTTARPSYHERGTNGQPTFNGVLAYMGDTSLFIKSQTVRAHAESTYVKLTNGYLYTGVQYSTNWGSSYAPI